MTRWDGSVGILLSSRVASGSQLIFAGQVLRFDLNGGQFFFISATWRDGPGGGSGFTFSFFLRIPPITRNGIPDEIPPKTAFSERKANSNLKNGIPEISGGIPDFLVENVIFLLQMLQTYEELHNLIEYFLYLLYIAMYNAY